MTVEDIVNYVNVEDFTNDKIEKTQEVLQSLPSRICCIPDEQETVAQVLLTPYMKGLQIIKRMALTENTGEMAVKEITNYLELAKLENFNSPTVQNAYLKLAKRVGNPLEVCQVIKEETAKDSDSQSMMGFTVLATVVLREPLLVTNIDKFWIPQDFSEEKSHKEITTFEMIPENIISTIPQERVLSSSNPKSLMRDVASFVTDILAHRCDSVETPISLLTMFPSLDNIASQAALLGLAAQVSSPSEVHQSISFELVTQKNILPAVGCLAVKKILENTSLHAEQVFSHINQETFTKSLDEKDNLLWENISALLHTESVPVECLTVEDHSLKKHYQNALRKISEQLSLAHNISSKEAFENPELLANSLTDLKAQVHMTKVAEKLNNAPISQRVISYEHLKDNDVSCLPFFGFKALKTAIESLPVSVSDIEVDSYLDIQDLDQETVKSSIALVLDTGLVRRTQVSKF